MNTIRVETQKTEHEKRIGDRRRETEEIVRIWCLEAMIERIGRRAIIEC